MSGSSFDTYINGVNSKALTKSREDENFLRKRLEVPLVPADHRVSGESTPERPVRPLRLVRHKHTAVFTVNSPVEELPISPNQFNRKLLPLAVKAETSSLGFGT